MAEELILMFVEVLFVTRFRANFFEKTQPTQALLSSFCLTLPNSGSDLDHKISRIRRNLPKFPDIPVDDTIQEEISSTAPPHKQDRPIKQLDSTAPTDIPRKGDRAGKNTAVTRMAAHDVDQMRARVPRRSSIFLGKAHQELGAKSARIYGVCSLV
jgi:hypothetical protein